MFSTINFIIGDIVAEQQPTKIMIGGFSTRMFFKEVERLYGSRIQKGMIYQSTMTRIEMPIFFAYDFMVLLKMLLEKGEGRIFRKKSTRDMISALEKLPLFKKIQEPVNSKLNKKALSKFTLEPMDHQKDFFTVYDANTQRFNLKGYVLAAVPGSGKTLMGLFLSEMLETTTTIIFSPNNALQRVWKDTLDTRYHSTPSYYIYGDNKEPTGKERYLVFNHENLKFAFETLKKVIKKGAKINIVVDECHAFNEMKSDRTKLLIEICKYLNCQETLFMSGTPFKALGAEILPFLWIADPYFNANTEERFKKIFGNNGARSLDILSARIGRSSFSVEKDLIIQNKRYEIDLKVTLDNGHEYTMSAIRKKMETFIKERVEYYKNAGPRLEAEYLSILTQYELTLETTQEKLAFASYRADVETIRYSRNLGDIPDIIARANLYENKTLIPKLPNSQKEPFRNSRSVYKYVALKIQGEALGRILGKERERCNVDILKGLDNCKAFCTELEWEGIPFQMADIFSTSKTKAIFFTDYVEVITEAGKLFTKAGMKPMLVYAETNKNLSAIIEAVEKDPKANPIVATYKSLSTAVPLVMLDTCVFLSQPFRSYIKEQAEARLDRLGQKNELLFYNVTLDTGTEPNISTRSLEILEWSKEMVQLLTNTKLSDDPEVIEQSFIDAYQSNVFMKAVKSTLGW